MRALLPLLAAGAAAAAADLQPSDRRRARLTVPGAHVGGHGAAEIAAKINTALRAGPAPLRDCADFTRAELNDLLRELLRRRSPELARVYRDRAQGDDRRLRYETLDEYERSWAAEDPGAATDSPGHEGKCMEALMLHAHHLSAAARGELRAALPLLPEYQVRHAEASRAYASQATCITGHNMTGKPNDHVWPHWPAEVHYHGTGFDAYPFWMGPEGEGGSGELEVWWSETKASEKFYHKTCGMSETGYSGGDAPCYNLFVGAQPYPQAWLYTAKEDFCCLSGPGTNSPKYWCYKKNSASGQTAKQGVTTCVPDGAGNCTFTDDTDVQNSDGGSYVGVTSKEECCAECASDKTCKAAVFVAATPGKRLSAPQGNFMDTMPYQGTGSFSGPYYKGTVKKYIIDDATGPVKFFWYYTDMNDLPVEQGEGGHGAGIAVHHDYNTSSFQATTLDDSVFAVPEICKTTTNVCTFPAS